MDTGVAVLFLVPSFFKDKVSVGLIGPRAPFCVRLGIT